MNRQCFCSLSWFLACLSLTPLLPITALGSARGSWLIFLRSRFYLGCCSRAFFLIGLSWIQEKKRKFFAWDHVHFDILHADVPKPSLPSIQQIYKVSKRDQFLMKLRPEFEVARAALLNRSPVPNLEVCLGELLREEQWLLTQSGMSHDQSTVNALTVAYSAQGTSKGRDMMSVQCFSCKQFGHIARNCGKKFCNYCKQLGHIITVRVPHKTCPASYTARYTCLSCYYEFC